MGTFPIFKLSYPLVNPLFLSPNITIGLVPITTYVNKVLSHVICLEQPISKTYMTLLSQNTSMCTCTGTHTHIDSQPNIVFTLGLVVFGLKLS